MNEAASATITKPETLAERFWSLARGMSGIADSIDPVAVVRHVLAILDALAAGGSGGEVSVRTVSFLKLLRESEQHGELSYSAPEQISGEMLDERSLVFSVGVLLFERLTGRHPFGAEGNNPRRLARIQKGEFGSGVNYFPTVPAGLRQILMKAMGPFPEERWASLDEMRARLDQFVDIERKPLSLPGTSTPSKRRAPASDHESTQVVNMAERVATERLFAAERAPTEPFVGPISELQRPAPPPAQAGLAGESVTPLPSPAKPQPVPMGPLPTPPPLPTPATHPWTHELPLAGMAWAGSGAIITTVLFLVLGGSGPASENAPMPVSVTPSAVSDAPQPPTSQPEARPVLEPSAPAVAEANPGVFDPEVSGQRIVTVARTCFPAQDLARGLSFSVGILFASGDGHVERVYYPSEEEISNPQRGCLRDAVSGQSANSPPATNTIVNYRLRLEDGADRIRFKLP